MAEIAGFVVINGVGGCSEDTVCLFSDIVPEECGQEDEKACNANNGEIANIQEKSEAEMHAGEKGEHDQADVGGGDGEEKEDGTELEVIDVLGEKAQ